MNNLKDWRHHRNYWGLDNENDTARGLTIFRKNDEQINVHWECSTHTSMLDFVVVEVILYSFIANTSVNKPQKTGQLLLDNIKLADMYYNTSFDKKAEAGDFCCQNPYLDITYGKSCLHWNDESVQKARKTLAENPLINFIELECLITFEEGIDISYVGDYLRVFHTKIYAGFYDKHSNYRFEKNVTQFVLDENKIEQANK
ncbi:hypothetical protein [Xenorhabdus sp. KJ12.1]|uniref:hypothetical protein n=1 Tax=Xenorhabdus sp. KJ12.1 TaxID=1851571 RepID=UPI000C03DFC8|nr:hypothetical protein [Xenorhabdus sp. KJ12.1]PHM72278.1 hypothetical protein Xekj_00556 [Xenorhabdus sp. KJ12.1]